MSTKTSYYLRFKSTLHAGYSFVDCRSLKSLEQQVKKFIDNKVTFEIWVQFHYNKKPKSLAWYGFDNYASFEV